jgi:hypothetical protein
MNRILYRIVSDRRLWEQRYADLWSVSHTISGALVAFALLWLGFTLWPALALSICIAVIWELFEKVTKLSATEYFTNNITDILFAQVGFLAFWFTLGAAPLSQRLSAFVALAIVFAVIVGLGWYSYARFRS